MGFTFTVVLNAHTEQFAQSASQLESVKMHPCGLLSKTCLEEYTLSHTRKRSGEKKQRVRGYSWGRERREAKGTIEIRICFSLSSAFFFLRISLW